MLNNDVIHSTEVKILDEIQPTVQQLLSCRARLLAELADTLMSAQTSDSPITSGLRVICNELRSIAKDIGAMEPEELPLSEVLLIHENKMARGWLPGRPLTR
jgi:hypothetical protein